MKTYHGSRVGTVGAGHVWVEEDGLKRGLMHRGRHSPDGFQWGYAGSGPSELALELVADVLGRDPEPKLYMQFKFDVIANIEDDEWTLTEDEIRQALMGQPHEPEPLDSLEKALIRQWAEREMKIVTDQLQMGGLDEKTRNDLAVYGRTTQGIWEKLHD